MLKIPKFQNSGWIPKGTKVEKPSEEYAVSLKQSTHRSSVGSVLTDTDNSPLQEKLDAAYKEAHPEGNSGEMYPVEISPGVYVNNVSAGYLSPNDWMGEFVVGGAAMQPLFYGLGQLGKYGLYLIAREIPVLRNPIMGYTFRNESKRLLPVNPFQSAVAKSVLDLELKNSGSSTIVENIAKKAYATPKTEEVTIVPKLSILYTPEELTIIDTWSKAARANDRKAGSKALLLWWKLKVPRDKVISLNEDELVTPYFHSTKAKKEFNEFDLTRTGQNWELSKRYGRPAAFFEPYYVDCPGRWGTKTRRYYINTLDLFVHNPLSDYPIPNEASTLSLTVEHLKRVRNMIDNTPPWKKAVTVERLLKPSEIMEEMVVFDPKLIKLASPFTYDDTGKLIDITQRFNFTNPDIRYAIPPVIVSTAKTLND